TIFACNFFGLFEINLFSRASSAAANTCSNNHFMEHFLRGAFATLLATPCSAPFVGTALSFALSRGPFEIILIFFAMGFGFSILYLLIAAFPKIKNIIPKPGPWMQVLRTILGVALVGTTIWLLYVLSIQLTLVAVSLIALLLLGIVAILLIKCKSTNLSKAGTCSLIVAFGIAGLAVPHFSMFTPDNTQHVATSGFWKPLDVKAIPGYIKKGKVVFVDVTAKWCSTCYYNKKFVLETEAVTKALTQPNIIAMRADWTKKDAHITRYLNSFDRHAIPFNAVYSKQYPKGIVLPELLTVNTVLKALNKAKTIKN
ncbi:MAG: thioredoxin family protein, partial [Coxiellaceae bacterium]|nr:thioredoxin family protein [Coxiellaceae bacterium]